MPTYKKTIGKKKKKRKANKKVRSKRKKERKEKTYTPPPVSEIGFKGVAKYIGIRQPSCHIIKVCPIGKPDKQTFTERNSVHRDYLKQNKKYDIIFTATPYYGCEVQVYKKGKMLGLIDYADYKHMRRHWKLDGSVKGGYPSGRGNLTINGKRVFKIFFISNPFKRNE